MEVKKKEEKKRASRLSASHGEKAKGESAKGFGSRPPISLEKKRERETSERYIVLLSTKRAMIDTRWRSQDEGSPRRGLRSRLGVAVGGGADAHG